MVNKITKFLSEVSSGQKVKVSSIKAGRVLNSRLAAMGLVANAEILVVSSGSKGPFVITVKGAKMMLGRGIAQKIQVLLN